MDAIPGPIPACPLCKAALENPVYGQAPTLNIQTVICPGCAAPVTARFYGSRESDVKDEVHHRRDFDNP